MLEVRVKQLGKQVAEKEATKDAKEAAKKEVAEKEAVEKEAADKEAVEKADNDEEEYQNWRPSGCNDNDSPKACLSETQLSNVKHMRIVKEEVSLS
jgi:hypothetical protein